MLDVHATQPKRRPVSRNAIMCALHFLTGPAQSYDRTYLGEPTRGDLGDVFACIQLCMHALLNLAFSFAQITSRSRAVDALRASAAACRTSALVEDRARRQGRRGLPTHIRMVQLRGRYVRSAVSPSATTIWFWLPRMPDR